MNTVGGKSWGFGCRWAPELVEGLEGMRCGGEEGGS